MLRPLNGHLTSMSALEPITPSGEAARNGYFGLMKRPQCETLRLDKLSNFSTAMLSYVRP